MKPYHVLSPTLVALAVCSAVATAQDHPCDREALLEPGDANRDFRFDVGDLLQVMRRGKFGSGEAASWEEGDCNGLFDETDVTIAFAAGHFLQGPYRLAVSGTPPMARGGAPAVWLPGSVETPADGQMLLFGGMNPITGDTSELWRFDLDTNRWVRACILAGQP